MGKNQRINTLIPMAYLYSEAHGRENLEELVIEHLTSIPAEKNRITALFAQLAIKAEHALHSQGLIQLKRYFCDSKKCLSCGIGHQVLK